VQPSCQNCANSTAADTSGQLRTQYHFWCPFGTTSCPENSPRRALPRPTLTAIRRPPLIVGIQEGGQPVWRRAQCGGFPRVLSQIDRIPKIPSALNNMES
jgi:hypothetical protein